MRVTQLDPRDRFTNRAAYYDATRPGYLKAVLDFLENELSFRRSSEVADIGSGTGILTEVLLMHGNVVFGVEPNEDMRRIAESKLSRYLSFKSVCGSAESTSLPDNSIDFIVAGQAFHWFRRTETKIEFGESWKSTVGWPSSGILGKIQAHSSKRTRTSLAGLYRGTVAK